MDYDEFGPVQAFATVTASYGDHRPWGAFGARRPMADARSRWPASTSRLWVMIASDGSMGERGMSSGVGGLHLPLPTNPMIAETTAPSRPTNPR